MNNNTILTLLRGDNSIDEEILKALLVRQGYSKECIEQIVKKVYHDKSIQMSKKEIDILSETIRFKASGELKQEKGMQKNISNIFSYLLFVFILSSFIWLIYDDQSRASIDFGISPSTTIVISFVIILLLALLEGSQIAIMDIHDKDISSVASDYGKAYDIQKLVRSKATLHDYLVGRQLLVVGIVTIFGLLTSFPNINEVWDLKIPGVLNLLAFKLGLINALILLWIGQLIPQLLATKAPLNILNHKVVQIIVYLCIYVSRTQIAKPSSLVVELFALQENSPPISDFDRFIINSEDYRYYLSLQSINVKYNSPYTADVTSVYNYSFEGNVARIVRRTIGLGASIDRHHLSNVIGSRSDRSYFTVIDQGNETDPIQDLDGITYYKHFLEPQTGNFNSGDTLKLTDEFSLSKIKQIDISIDKPVRVLYIKCVISLSILTDSNIRIPNLILEEYSWDLSTETYSLCQKIRIEPVIENDSVVVSHAIPFPSKDAKYSLFWDIDLN